MRIYHNITTRRWVVETRRWAAAGNSLSQALWQLLLCFVSEANQ